MKIPLTRGYEALIDDEDYAKVAAYARSWQAAPKGNGIVYARTTRNVRGNSRIRFVTYLHVLVTDRLDATDGLDVAHRNGDGLDCRKENLVVVTHSRNASDRRKLLTSNNTSGVHGVWWCANTNKWVAEINVDSQRHYLGRFASIQDAALARRAKEQEFGIFLREGDVP